MVSETTIAVRSLIALLALIALFAGTIVLQVYLSRRESRWPGLVLPILSFILALTAALGMVVFNYPASGKLTVTGVDSDGTVTNQTVPVELEGAEEHGIGKALIGGGIVFLVCNIPTVIYTAIYCGEREKYRRREQMKKMNIQDLE